MKDTLGVLLAGGAGERLYPLTRDRAKPAVTFGGMYRIIDITLSNCLNSDLRRVYILTQYKALSLNRHIREGWNILGREVGEFVEVLAAHEAGQRPVVSGHRRRGLPEHLFHRLRAAQVRPHPFRRSHLQNGLRQDDEAARDSAADVTLATIQIDPAETARFGVVDVDKDGRINGFEEKPKLPRPTAFALNPEKVAGSMGVYLFNADVLIPVLLKDAEDPNSSTISAKTFCPRWSMTIASSPTTFVDENKKEALYWRDVGTLEAYYEANMDIVSVSPIFNLYDQEWPIRTHQRQYPPAKFVFAEKDRMGTALDSIVSNGCIVSGGVVKNSVLSPDVRVNSYSEVDSSILFSHVAVGRHCRIRRCIIDRNVHLPEGTTIGYDTEADRSRYFVTDSGITVVTRDYSLFENP
jgi:glucose-1-phosphate adenylyltransferase